MNRATPLVLAALLSLSSLALAPGAEAAPAISSVSPSSGSTNGGTVLNITGGGFVQGAIVQLIQGSTTATLTNLVVTPSNIRGTTPPTPTQAPGSFQVRVTNPDSSSTLSGASFTYTAAALPAVTGFSPIQGPSTGGTTILISGSSFSTAVKPFVTVAGVPAVVQSATATSIVAVTSARDDIEHKSSSGNVEVTNPDGSAKAVSSQPFNYVRGSPPILRTISPTTGDANGGAAFTLTGDNLVPGAIVKFLPSGSGDGPLATGVGYIVSSGQITGKTPPQAASATARSVQVINPDGLSATLAQVFTVTAGPSAGAGTFRVTSVAPRSGPSSGGTPVTIGGMGFAAGPGLRVFFGANEATGVTFVNNTQVTAITPACPAGGNPCSGDITVRNPDGTTSLPLPEGNTFTYMQQVVIASALRSGSSANSVDTSGRQQIVISGSGFIAPCQVYVGGIKATETACSPSGITVTAPAGTPGSKDIQVINADGRTATLQG
ncbi:MAG: IPT/TIG domain-containing protein, partial [Halobacteriales archaeon]|nr:IPT/TIG domain-containing protein [Halobacteriales archaeon]